MAWLKERHSSKYSVGDIKSMTAGRLTYGLWAIIFLLVSFPAIGDSAPQVVCQGEHAENIIDVIKLECRFENRSSSKVYFLNYPPTVHGPMSRDNAVRPAFMERADNSLDFGFGKGGVDRAAIGHYSRSITIKKLASLLLLEPGVSVDVTVQWQLEPGLFKSGDLIEVRVTFAYIFEDRADYMKTQMTDIPNCQAYDLIKKSKRQPAKNIILKTKGKSEETGRKPTDCEGIASIYFYEAVADDIQIRIGGRHANDR